MIAELWRAHNGCLAPVQLLSEAPSATLPPAPNPEKQTAPKSKQPERTIARAAREDPGGDLLSHTKNHAVPSAQRSLTTEFGMGSGVTSSLRPPGIRPTGAQRAQEPTDVKPTHTHKPSNPQSSHTSTTSLTPSTPFYTLPHLLTSSIGALERTSLTPH